MYYSVFLYNFCCLGCVLLVSVVCESVCVCVAPADSLRVLEKGAIECLSLSLSLALSLSLSLSLSRLF
jgi:hypothetical protein